MTARRPGRTGPATQTELEALHRLLLKTLTERLKGGRVGIEHLAVARAFLSDNGFAGNWTMPYRTQKSLEKLYAALCLQYAKAMESPDRQEAGILAEVRMHLRAQGITKDFEAVLDGVTAGAVVQRLAGVDLPFKPRE